MGRAAPVPAPRRRVVGSHPAAAEELCRTLFEWALVAEGTSPVRGKVC